MAVEATAPPRRQPRLTPAQKNDRPHMLVFVCGLHRSGTSLLHSLLQEHPEISGFENTGVPENEGQHLQNVYAAARRFGGPGRFGFASDAYMDESHPLASEANARRLFQQWSPYWHPGCHWLLEKSPPNLIRTRFLQRLFPASAFLVILRHPVAVSYATRKWSRTRIGSLLRHWLLCHEQFLSDLPHLQRVHVLRYEDLVNEPQKQMRAVLRFLDLPPEAWNRPIGMRINTTVNRGYLDQWRRRRSSPVRMLAPDRLVRGLGPRVAQFGYSLRTPDRLEPVRLLGSHPPD